MKITRFHDWLAQGSNQLESVTRNVIAKTLTTNTYTLLDGRSFVIVERGLISFDGFYYTPDTKEFAPMMKEAKAIISKKYSL